MSDAGDRVVMTGDQLARTVTRMAHEILEKNTGDERLAIVGIHTRGAFLARRLHAILRDIAGRNVPLGDLDISFYRDDVAARGAYGVVPSTPNPIVVAVARAPADAGAVSLINTLRALVLDPQSLAPFLGNRTGRLCGPAIKPVALRMVWEIASALEVPIIGMGGIATGRDALEFVACGATAVAVGATNFTGPDAARRIVAELSAEMAQRGLPDLAAVRGRALGRS